jgi:hypothetical protein
MTKNTKLELKRLFSQEEKLTQMIGLMEYGIHNGSLTFKASKRSNLSLDIHDPDLFRMIQAHSKAGEG